MEVDSVQESDHVVEEAEYETDEGEFLSDKEMTESKFDDKQSKQYHIIGADVVSMYPSLDAVAASKLVYEAVLESKVEFKGLNHKEVITYLALNMNITEARHAKIAHLLPKRRSRRGRRPLITGKQAMAAESHHEEHWIFPSEKPTRQELKMLFAKCLEIATLTLFTTHLYQFNAIIHKQKSGAPIGLRISCAVAKIVMNMFDRRFDCKWYYNVFCFMINWF